VPLLERHAEVAALAAMVDAARTGDGRLVAIEGPAGIGKTRLLAEARALAAEAGLGVQAARAGELEREFAFGVVRQLFEPLIATSSPEARAGLLSGAAALAAPLFEHRSATAGADAGGDASFPILHGLYWLAANMALQRPLLLAVDDLHWADPPSVRWLTYLARRLEGLPLLLVVATRPAEDSRQVSIREELLADSSSVVVRPAALGTAAVRALINELLSAMPDEPFVAAAQTASAGNPLFLRAVVDAFARERLPPTAANVNRLLEKGPEAVSRGIAVRLAHMPDSARSLLSAAAVLGDGVELGLAATLAELEPAEAADAATILVRADLLRRENPVEFAHPIVRTAIHDGLTGGERLRLHRDAAEMLLGQGARPEQAAAHLVWTLPADDPFVMAALRRAAESSLAQGAPETAIAYLRRALAESPAAAERADLLRKLGLAQLSSAPAEALPNLKAALESVQGDSDCAETAVVYGMTLVWVDRWHEGFEVIRSALAGLGGRPIDLVNRLQAHLISIAAYSGDDDFFEVAKMIESLSPDDLGSGEGADLLRVSLALYAARAGRSLREAIDLAEAGLRNNEVRDSTALVLLIQAAMAHHYAGDLDRAAHIYKELLDETRRRGDLITTGVILMYRGHLETQRGELARAEEDLRSPEVDTYRSLQVSSNDLASFIAELLLERGDIEEAEEILAGVPPDERIPALQFPTRTARGRLLLERGRPLEAIAELEAVGAKADALNFRNPAIVPWRSRAALALRALDRKAEAYALVREELELSRRWGAPRAIGISLRALGLVQGGATGEARLREAVDVLAGSPARLEHARALVDLGAALRRANSRSEARRHLRNGVDLAHQCGASALVERGNEELAATGAHPRKIMLSGLESLTASERRVAQMAAEEVSNKEIAQSLFVTVKTVEVHLSRVYRKLDITSRRELASALSAPAAKTAAAT
jgi:DNA-binding CsgD family transcriptional regulator